MLEYSPDGTKLAYDSFRSGDQEIWLCDAEGKGPKQLTSFGEASVGGWSPSGDQIAFASSAAPGGDVDILVMDETGGFRSNLTSDEYGDGCPSWSVDGNWVYYHSMRADGTQIYKVPADGGPAEQLTEKGGLMPQIAEDGHVLFWRESRIWRLSRDETEETVVSDKEVGNIFHWCPWRENIVYIVQNEEGESVIEMFNLRSGETRQLHSFDQGVEIGHGFTVSPDGQWILYTPVEFNADLMLVENFY
jgi:Tol biopolymer transport system component